jgi:manganese oxidase
MMLPLLVVLAAAAASPEPIAINNNRTSAGTLRGNVLTLHLEAREGAWYPDGPKEMLRTVAAFGEMGKPLQNPGPLVRVKRGTEVRIMVHNKLKMPMTMFGLGTKRGVADSVVIAAGAAHEFAFTANEPGVFFYAGKTGKSPLLDRDLYDSQLNGIIAVDDESDAALEDRRLFLISWWGSLDSTKVSGLQDGATIVINGASWPHTERLHAVQNQAQRYAFVNATSSVHPLHLHGFYFSVDGVGTASSYTKFAPDQRQLAVTQIVSEGGAIAITWTPERPGNWVLHCHFAGHIASLHDLNKDRRMPDAHAKHAADPHRNMMEAMVLGIHVEPRGEVKASSRTPRNVRLLARSQPKVYGEYVGYSYATDEKDAFTAPGPVLVLEQHEPVAINIVNKTHESAGVHWHGIELDSYPDGVPSFSGMGKNILPPIPANDSLTVRFTPPRAGTFMYHSHMNEMQQIGSGLYGALIVLPPGQKYDAEKDRVLLISDGGPVVDLIRGPYPPTWVNGSANVHLQELKAGQTYRFRIINIRADTRARLELMDGDKHVQWKVIARDGADLPASQITTTDANLVTAPGEIRDVEFTPTTTGALKLRYGYVRPTPQVAPTSEVRWEVR